MDAKVKMIPMVDACDMPMEVLDYCDTKEIPTHYQSAVAFIPDDGNVFAEWLKRLGVEFPDVGRLRVGILAT